METLDKKIVSKVEKLFTRGDKFADEELFEEALDCYYEAWELLPEPKIKWDAATVLLGSIGDLNFATGDFEAGRNNLQLAMQCPNAVGNPFLHLRLGQCHFELNETEFAADELVRAFSEGGPEIFDADDLKYLHFVQGKIGPILKN
jgi:tetratricopeptide (TPR) repeat protein